MLHRYTKYQNYKTGLLSYCLLFLDVDGDSDSVLHINVCSWESNVETALQVKIEDDAEEMGAFMKQGYEFYLTGSDYKGYDGVIINNATVISFELATPSPTGDGGIAPTIFETTGTKKENEPFHIQMMDYWLYGALGLVAICCCILLIIFICVRKQRKMKQVCTVTRYSEKLRTKSSGYLYMLQSVNVLVIVYIPVIFRNYQRQNGM